MSRAGQWQIIHMSDEPSVSNRVLRHLRWAKELIGILSKVEWSLYGLRHQYALVNNKSSLVAAQQQFPFIDMKTIDIYTQRKLAFSNMAAPLDVLYRICSHLYRFRQRFLSIGSVLDRDPTNKQLLRAEYGNLCSTICERWLSDAVFDGFSENIYSMSSERVIRILFETVKRDGINDFPTNLAECVRLVLVERGEYSIEKWRRCSPIYVAR